MTTHRTTRVPQFRAVATGVARIAVLPVEALEKLATDGRSLDEQLLSLWSDDTVAEGVYYASPGLFERLSQWEFLGSKFSDVKFAFSKYVRRMGFRATPFGTFSIVGSIGVGREGGRLLIPASNQIARKLHLDSAHSIRMYRDVTSLESNFDRVTYTVNDTVHRIFGSIRFLAIVQALTGRRSYRLVELASSPELETVLRLAERETSISELVDGLRRSFPGTYGEVEVREYIRSLVEAQVLCTDHFVSLSDGDFLKSLSERIGGHGQPFEVFDALVGALDRVSMLPLGKSVGQCEELVQKYFPNHRHSEGENALQASLTAADDSIGALPPHVTRAIENAASVVSSLSPPIEWNLGEFARRFSDRYGDGWVPLMELLDDINGLGFGGQDEGIVAQGKGSLGPLKEKGVVGARFSELLARTLQPDRADPGNKVDYLNLSSSDLDFISEATANPREKNQFMLAWCSVWSKIDDPDELVPELGDVTLQDPCRVLGRFSQSSRHVSSLMSQLRKQEESPDSLVVEIVHLAQDNLGNLTTRASNASYEISIRTGRSSTATLIPLADILVNVVGERVVLRSATHGKTLIVRMSNAHNFNAAEGVAAYKFLNAVSCQYVGKCNLSLRKYFTERRYLPGLRIDGVIISRPTWLIMLSDIRKLAIAAPEEQFDVLKRWRDEYQLPRWVTLVDNPTMPFDLTTRWMARELIKELEKMRGGALLTEAFPAGLKSAVRSVNGTHHHELLITFLNQRFNAMGHHAVPRPDDKYSILRIGSDWLYFNVYVEPAVQNEVLQRIDEFASGYGASSEFHGYFYIRYRDATGHHLRVRFQGAPRFLTDEIIGAFARTLRDLALEGFVKDFSVRSYVREIVRYGGEISCSAAEQIFIIDSKLCADVLRETASESYPDWWVPAIGIDRLLEAIGIKYVPEKLAFARIASSDFAVEMNFDSAQRKRIGNIYRSTRPAKGRLLSEAMPEVATSFDKSAQLIAEQWRALQCALDKLTSDREIYQVRWSLIHMRVNRLISGYPRRQEAIVWDLLRRTYEAHLAVDATQFARVEPTLAPNESAITLD